MIRLPSYMKLKNLLIEIIHNFSSLLPKNPQDNQKILIVSTTGLGDTLWATPAIAALRKKLPKAYIALLTTPLGSEVLQGNPHIDELFIFKKPHLFSLFFLGPVLRKKRFGEIFIFHASQRILPLFCSYLGACRIVGSEGQYKGPKTLFTSIFPAKKEHEIDRRLSMIGVSEKTVPMEIFFGDTEMKKARKILPQDHPIIGIHPGAKDSFKQWPIEHFISLGNALKKEKKCQIIVTGGPSEKELVKQVCAGIEGAVAMPSTLTIQEFAAILSQFSLFITNDTGPMHLATAVQTPLIALFSPTDPVLCGPLKIGKYTPTVIQKRKACAPCLKKKCREAFCLRQISVQEVLNHALKKLKNTPNP